MFQIVAVLLLLVTLLLFLFCWHKFVSSPYRFFKSGICRLPHPPVTPFVGNAQAIKGQDSLQTFEKWIIKYGKVFGYYIGANPYILVADIGLLKEIMVKQSDKFIDSIEEPVFFIPVRVKHEIGIGLQCERGQKWKETRAIVSPSFSGKKLKLMTPLIDRTCHSLGDRLNEINSEGKSFDFLHLFRRFTMESVLATVMGSQVNILKGEANSLTKVAEGLFTDLSHSSMVWSEVFESQFPTLMKMISQLSVLTSVSTQFYCLKEVCVQIINARRSQKDVMNKDLLQLLIDARAEDDHSSKKTLTDEEIVGLSIEFLMAGYDTTSNTLAYTSYLLAVNPDKQDILCEAIDKYYRENEETTLYDASQNIPYLDWVVQETLRIYSPAPMTDRKCTDTCTVGGITIPKGTSIKIPLQHLHHSVDYWDQPDLFQPERFSPEEKEGRPQLCYMPFGSGPRICIGMRFALLQAKMCLVSVLKEYKFERAPDTQVPLKLKLGMSLSPKDGVFLKVAKR